jgi:amphi-Trp domain-containing protein
MTEKLLQTETRVSRTEAAEKLHSLADKISEGKVELKSGSDSVKLEPADSVEFELEVEEEDDGDQSIEVEIEWSNKEKSDVEIS